MYSDAGAHDVPLWDEFDTPLPDDRGFVVPLRAYFDASGRESGVFCVAGYLFEAESARGFARDAERAFGTHGGLHMTDLATGGGRYRTLSKQDRVELVIEATRLIRKYVLAGVAISCWTQDVKNFGPNWIVGFRHAYSLLCHLSVTALGTWLRRRWPNGCGGVAYVFESGDDYSNEANILLNNAQRHGTIRDSYQYRSHVFACKADAPPLCAADFLAWEWTKFWDETVATPKRPMRQSLKVLLSDGWDFAASENPKYCVRHLGGPMFVRFFDQIRALGVKQVQERLDRLPESVQEKLDQLVAEELARMEAGAEPHALSHDVSDE